MAKLGKDEIVTLQVLKGKGESNRAIARRLNVSEGAMRYHLMRQAAGAKDGRQKSCLIEELGLEQVVDHWWQLQCDMLPKDRSPNIQQLWYLLVEDHDYSGSYKSIRKYVRSKFWRRSCGRFAEWKYRQDLRRKVIGWKQRSPLARDRPSRFTVS